MAAAAASLKLTALCHRSPKVSKGGGREKGPADRRGPSHARRSDARAAALDLAALQEKWYFQNNSFTDDITKLDPDGLSHEGHYTVALDNPCGDLTCFTIEVEPTGDQADDLECALFTVTHTGRKEAEDSDGEDNTDRCWGN